MMAMLLCQFSCGLWDHIGIGAMMCWLYSWASNVALAASLKKVSWPLCPKWYGFDSPMNQSQGELTPAE
jgi:hypothetical protein